MLVLGPNMKGKIKNVKSQIINVSLKNIPKLVNLRGRHNLENIACAMAVARALKVPEAVIKRVVENFKPVAGRLELVKTIKGIEIFNDTNSCTPEATSAALKTLGKGKNIILIMGGTDKNLELKNLVKDIQKYAKALILIPGNGTDRFANEELKVESYKVDNLKQAMRKSLGLASGGEIILFSPAFTSFGMFQNEYDRGDQFMKIVKKLK